MKVCAISDLHGDLPQLEPCELVLICGDSVPLSCQGSYNKTRKWYFNTFNDWAKKLDCNKVIFIAGNHELYLENHEGEYKANFLFNNKITYLCHNKYEYTSLDGKVYSIFGTPYCQKFGSWAFMLSNDILVDRYNEVPEGLDILITHDQPYDFGDVLLQKDCPWATGENIGNGPLLGCILKKQPRYQFNGHLHSCDHNKIMIKNTVHYNVSLKDEHYNMVYNPLYIDIEK